MPHHGSRSSLPTFLTAARASLALVSVGRGNTYGHPNPGVMGLLAGSGALVRRTDESGDLAVVVGAEHLPRVDRALAAKYGWKLRVTQLLGRLGGSCTTRAGIVVRDA